MSDSPYQRPTINLYGQLSAKQQRDLQAGQQIPQGESHGRSGKTTERSATDVYGDLGIPPSVQNSKLADKHVALQNPHGKTSELRESRQKTQKAEKQKQKQAKIRGNKSRGLLPRKARKQGLVMSWSTALGLHRLWLGYMSELLGLDLDMGDVGGTLPTQPVASTSQSKQGEASASTSASRHQGHEVQLSSAHEEGYTQGVITTWHTKLSKADYHGCLISVKQSKNPSLQGLTGIIIQETEGTWSIAQPNDTVKVLPKPGSIFTFSLPLKTNKRLHFDVAGSQFAQRAADRVQRKYKSGTKPSFQHDALQ